MEAAQKRILQFISEYFRTLDQGDLLRTMLKNKDVQQVVANCIAEISSSIHSPTIRYASCTDKPTTSKSETRYFKPELVSENYVKIKSKVEDISERIKDIKHLQNDDWETGFARSKINTTNDEKLANFLEEMTSYAPPDFLDIRDISSDSWHYHTQIEQFMQKEGQKFQEKYNKIESKYLYRVLKLKEKSGVKIKKLEQELEELEKKYNESAERCEMVIQDLVSQLHENKNKEGEKEETCDHSKRSNFKKTSKENPKILKKVTSFEQIIKNLKNRCQILNDANAELTKNNTNLKDEVKKLHYCFDKVLKLSKVLDSDKKILTNCLEKKDYLSLFNLIAGERIRASNTQEIITKLFFQLKDEVKRCALEIPNKKYALELLQVIENFNIESILGKSEQKQFELLSKLDNLSIPSLSTRKNSVSADNTPTMPSSNPSHTHFKFKARKENSSSDEDFFDRNKVLESKVETNLPAKDFKLKSPPKIVIASSKEEQNHSKEPYIAPVWISGNSKSIKNVECFNTFDQNVNTNIHNKYEGNTELKGKINLSIKADEESSNPDKTTEVKIHEKKEATFELKTEGNINFMTENELKTKGNIDSMTENELKTEGNIDSMTENKLKTKGNIDSMTENELKTKGNIDSMTENKLKTKSNDFLYENHSQNIPEIIEEDSQVQSKLEASSKYHTIIRLPEEISIPPNDESKSRSTSNSPCRKFFINSSTSISIFPCKSSNEQFNQTEKNHDIDRPKLHHIQDPFSPVNKCSVSTLNRYNSIRNKKSSLIEKSQQNSRSKLSEFSTRKEQPSSLNTRIKNSVSSYIEKDRLNLFFIDDCIAKHNSVTLKTLPKWTNLIKGLSKKYKTLRLAQPVFQVYQGTNTPNMKKKTGNDNKEEFNFSKFTSVTPRMSARKVKVVRKHNSGEKKLFRLPNL